MIWSYELEVLKNKVYQIYQKRPILLCGTWISRSGRGEGGTGRETQKTSSSMNWQTDGHIEAKSKPGVIHNKYHQQNLY